MERKPKFTDYLSYDLILLMAIQFLISLLLRPAKITLFSPIFVVLILVVVPQFLILTRLNDYRRSNRPFRAYLLVNEAFTLALVLLYLAIAAAK